MAPQVYKAKLPKAFFVISISLFKSFEEYTSYFERYKNKHIAIKTGLEELSKIDIPECQVDILMVILNLFDLLSIHEMGGYFHDICGILSLSLVKIDPLSPAFRAFAEIHWKRMSKVVLSLQRVSASEVKVKKKKLDSLSVSGSSKAVLKKLQLARSIEEKAGIADGRIKMRGFAMK